MKWEVSLAKWREERGLVNPSEAYMDMMAEEEQEYKDAVAANDWHEQVDALCDQMVLTTNALFVEGHGDKIHGAFSLIENKPWAFGEDNRSMLMTTRSNIQRKTKRTSFKKI